MSLIEKFHTFYDELLSVERRIASGEMTARDAREALERHLERAQLAAEREAGSYGVEMFVRAKYAMAALADEHMLAASSPAHETWISELLEAAVFKSQRAGEKLFRDIEELQSERRGESEDLARVYLAVLGLGFQGKYRDVRDADAVLEQYRRNLYRIVFAREPQEGAKMIPAAYAATLDDSSNTELPYLRPWILALVLIVLIWIAASHAIWVTSIAEIEPFIDEVISLSLGGS